MTTSINSEAQTNRGMDKKTKWVIVEQMFLTMKKQRDNMKIFKKIQKPKKSKKHLLNFEA